MPKFILQDFHCCLKYFNHASQHATPRSKHVSARLLRETSTTTFIYEQNNFHT